MAKIDRSFDPVTAYSDLGGPNVGTQTSGFTAGSQWEMAIALPVKNRRFERGQVKEYTLTSGPFLKLSMEQNDTQIGISSPEVEPNLSPSKFIQYGDKAFVGPSSDLGDVNRSEPVRVLAASEELGLGQWTNGTLYFSDRSNKFTYQTGDSITVYGTGCADSWVPTTSQLHTLGIQRGPVSLNNLGKYSLNPADISIIDNALANNLLVLGLRLPTHASYNASLATGRPAVFNSKLGLGPWRNPLQGGNDDTWDWREDVTNVRGLFRYLRQQNQNNSAHVAFNGAAAGSIQEFAIRLYSTPPFHITNSLFGGAAGFGDIIAQGMTSSFITLESGPAEPYSLVIADQLFEITNPTVTANITAGDISSGAPAVAQRIADAINAEVNFSVNASVFAVSDSYPVKIYLSNRGTPGTITAANDIFTSLITGFYHPGGERSDFAQCLFAMVNNRSESAESLRVSVGALRQILSSEPSGQADDRTSLIVGGTYYRMGLVWKGELTPDDATNTAGSEFYAAFRWQPLVSGAFAGKMLSTSSLLGSSNRSQSTWAVNMVSGFVDKASVDQLGDPQSQRVEIIVKASSPEAYGTTRDTRGAELNVLVDNLWIEHQGDIEVPGNPGYVPLKHFPEQATLQVNKVKVAEAITIEMANGVQRLVGTDDQGHKERYVIDADFVNVKKEVWDTFQTLMRWQDKGHMLTLHPYLPAVPHCLVGRMEITNTQKNFWDLEMFTFHFKFVEMD